MGKASRNKGKVGEREFAALLRDHGFDARRGVQHSGGPDSPDVVSDLPVHVEVKRCESLRLWPALAQAEADAGGSPYVVAHRPNHRPWVVIQTARQWLADQRELARLREQSTAPRRGA